MEIAKYDLSAQSYQTILESLRKTQQGRFYHWKRDYFLQVDKTIYSVSLNIFERIHKFFYSYFGNYFNAFCFPEAKEVKFIQRSEEIPPFYEADIALRTNTGGLVGKDNAEFVEEELEGLKLLNGEDIPAGENELLLNFLVFNGNDKHKNDCNLSLPLMPASLFEGKKEGEKIRFLYKDKLLEWTIRQKNISTHGSRFEDCFACTKKEVLKAIDEGTYGFSGEIWARPEDPLEGYTLEHGGVLYQFDVKNQNSPIKEAPVQKLAEPKTAKVGTEYLSAQNTTTKEHLLRFPFCGTYDHIDIVLNEKFLCFYSKNSSPVPINHLGNNETIDMEYLYIFPWKKIYPISLNEMQAILLRAKCELKNGMFEMRLTP